MTIKDVIKGKYWTLRLVNHYKIATNHRHKVNDSTIPPSNIPIDIICWNNDRHLSFFSHNCFGAIPYNKSQSSSYYYGHFTEYKIKLNENLPGQNIHSFQTKIHNENSKAHVWNGSISAENKIYYGFRYGIFYQLTYNKNTGSYFFYEYDKKTHHSYYYGSYRYNDSTGHYDIWYNDRTSNFYSNNEMTQCTNIVWQNQGYLGQMAFLEPENVTSPITFNQLALTFLTMSTSTVYCKQYANNNSKSSCSCNSISQPSGVGYDSYMYYGYDNYASHIALANSKRTVHIHFPTNGIWIGNREKLYSNNCGTNMHRKIDNVRNGTGSSAKNLSLPNGYGYYGERRYWDINENNIVVVSTSNGIGALNLGKEVNLKSNNLSLPSSLKTLDTSGNYIYTPWRIINRRKFVYNNSYADFSIGKRQIRINDNNNIVSLCNNYLYISSYNMFSNQFEKSEVFYISDMYTTSETYTAAAINNNDEIVIMDTVYGDIAVYKLEDNTSAHAFSFDTQTKRELMQNNSKDAATVEEAISIEVKHRTAIEQCEIVISPRELDDPNLMPLDGRILLKSNEPFLYSVFGDTYRTNDVDLNAFKLPDLRGRYPIGRGQDSQYEGINAQIQSFSLESLNDFGFNPINNQIKKYYKSASAKQEVNLTNTQAVKSVTLTNTNEINTTRKSVSIDDKCYMFYIRKVD